MYRTGMVLAIICLFIGASVLPSISSEICRTEKIRKELGGSGIKIKLGATTINDENEVDINVDKIWFNWGSLSGATTLSNCETNEPVVTPEFDSTIGRNNPVAYIKGRNITMKVKFSSQYNTIATIKATGSFGGLIEQEVVFTDGVSEWINFTTYNPIPNMIKVLNATWEWWFNTSSNEGWEKFDTTSHTIYSLNKEPLTETVWKKLAEWTTRWCEGLPDDNKELADNILSGFVNDKVVKYGDSSGRDTSMVLRAGYSTCGGMSELFYDACATQGVKTAFFAFRPFNTFGLIRPRWLTIIMCNPGIGRTDFGNKSVEKTWLLVNETYPYPSYFGRGNETDDVDRYTMRAYSWVDGHALNLLNYNGEIYLYDLSMGKGPIGDVFDFAPRTWIYKSSQVRNFRENYVEHTIDYLHGYIHFIDANGKKRPSIRPFTINTSIIPDYQINFIFYIGYERPFFHFSDIII